ncbi:polysaccharide deacetylase family protein, partial [Actinoplanes nipponensis]
LLAVPMRPGSDPDVNPVNAADHGTVTATKAPARKPGKAPRQDAEPPAAAPKPTTTTPARPAAQPSGPARPAPSATTTAPAIPVPEGNGPARSLRTTGSTVVALTFDDGPDPVQTPKILELLAQHRVKATFCLVGTQVRRHPEIVRQIVAAGHTLCNHTWDHSLTIGQDKPGKIQADLRRTNEAIRAAVPGAQIPFFRAPGGNFTDALVQTAYADGMTSLYWEVDPRDWEHAEEEDDAAHVEKIVKGVQKDVRAGAIVLSHDFNQPDTILAYEQLLPWLTDNFALGIPEQPEPPAAAPSVAASPASGAL